MTFQMYLRNGSLRSCECLFSEDSKYERMLFLFSDGKNDQVLNPCRLEKDLAIRVSFISPDYCFQYFRETGFPKWHKTQERPGKAGNKYLVQTPAQPDVIPSIGHTDSPHVLLQEILGRHFRHKMLLVSFLVVVLSIKLQWQPLTYLIWRFILQFDEMPFFLIGICAIRSPSFLFLPERQFK